MAVVFDTGDFAPTERHAAAVAALRVRSFPTSVEFLAAENISAVLELWDYGKVTAFRAQMSGNRQIRTARHIRRGAVDTLAIAVQERGIGLLEQHGFRQLCRPGELMIVDLDAPYVCGWEGAGAARSVRVPTTDAGVHHDEFPDLVRRLGASPFCSLVAGHIWHLCGPGSASDASGHLIGSATTSLFHGLFADLRDPGEEPTPDSLMARVTDFVSIHLTDPELSASMIADNLGVSTVALRRLSESTQFDLERWILSERLGLARNVLADQAGTWHPEQSRRWGFGNASFFTEEFSAAYGVSPGEWQQITTAEAAPDHVGDDPT
ncbi:AraC-like ligand-binding domain-containing protein [Gordonia insulae]|uniref:HTH araC/xylS-type domain-containing protein n=1 Tax=Gordonia insulae TaxID=2420509 RepID=A0A3G8JHA8_9ACTN|nr:helix-turn-helix domain-containing protein [Gordonia insulae]AZG44477.1 hypothetical protein D7316_01063 [Gordonia insulae]